MSTKKKVDRVIFHVDMDSFYASCEMARNPSLKEGSFIVGADPKEGRGRGVVLSCNYIARKIGIHSGMPISQAWKLCPNGTYVPPHHEMYGEVSRRIIDILKQFSTRVEQVSIDEAYLDFSSDPSIAYLSSEDQEKAIKSIATAIKNKVKSEEGITCSIGISNSKLVAKIATDFNKPDGLTLIRPQDIRQFLNPLPVEKIPGVGKVTQKILLETFNVRSILDLQKVPVEDLKEKFGRTGIWLHEVSLGNDDREVVNDWEPTSESGETTFEEDESDFTRIKDVMHEVATDVHKRTLIDGFLFRNVGIKIRFSGFETHTRSHMLPVPTDSLNVVLKECDDLLSEFSTAQKPVRLIGVRLASLEEKLGQGQKTLQEWS